MNKKGSSNLSSYFKSLLPSLKKESVVIDLTHTYEELNRTVAPMYDLDLKMELRGRIADRVGSQVKKGFKGFNRDIYRTVALAIKTISKQEDDVQDMVDNTFSLEIVKAVMDYKKLNVMNYVEALNFFNEYSRLLILALVYDEFDEETASMIASPIDRATADWVMAPANVQSFIKVLNVLTMPTSDFLKSLSALEGHTFNPEEWDAVKAVNGRKLDPHGFALVPVSMNPIYHIGLAVNAWRVARHERNKEELAKIQLMVLALQDAKSRTKDPEKTAKLAEQIKYRSNQANRLSAKIEDLEEGE